MTEKREIAAPEPPLDCRVMRPGAGWRHIAGAVYEHTNGTRVHLLGMIRLPNGEWVSANKWPESKDADRFVRMNGGNWKRGLMAWARAHNAKLSRGGQAMTDAEADAAQNWKGMDGAIAWHLIERHADGWNDVGAMMNAWLRANGGTVANA